MAEPFNPAGQRRAQQAAPAPVSPESLAGSSAAKPSPVHGNKVTEATSPRIDAERASRRRRQDSGPMTGLKLAVPEGSGEGTPVKRLVGKQDGGAPLYAYLCRKPKDFYQADKARELRSIREREDAIKRGPGAIEGGLPGGSTSYVPDQGNQIG
jgi:hypothetical protein